MLGRVGFNIGKMLPKKLIIRPRSIAKRGPYLEITTPLISPVKTINIEKIPPIRPDIDNEILKWSIKLPIDGASFARLIAPTIPQQTINQEKKTSFTFVILLINLVM